MPQPLSKILKLTGEYSSTYSADAFDEHPKLATLVAKAIARWASIEQTLGEILIGLLGAQAAPGVAMFSALTNIAAQKAALQAAAETILEEPELSVFRTAMDVVTSQQKIRNKLVHHIWGSSPQIPKGLLLVDPKHMLSDRVTFLKAWNMLHDKIVNLGNCDNSDFFELSGHGLSNIFVYRESDLVNINRDFEETAQIVASFSILMDPLVKGSIHEKDLSTKLLSLRLYQQAHSKYTNQG